MDVLWITDACVSALIRTINTRNSNLVCVHVQIWKKRRKSTKEKTDRPTPMKKQQAWNGLYRAAAADDDVDDTA